jgi:uncharacterized glyoxalase superfamily protein PhnB
MGLAPTLSVRNGACAVDFYRAVFGATELFRVEAPDGATAGLYWSLFEGMRFPLLQLGSGSVGADTIR